MDRFKLKIWIPHHSHCEPGWRNLLLVEDQPSETPLVDSHYDVFQQYQVIIGDRTRFSLFTAKPVKKALHSEFWVHARLGMNTSSFNTSLLHPSWMECTTTPPAVIETYVFFPAQWGHFEVQTRTSTAGKDTAKCTWRSQRNNHTECKGLQQVALLRAAGRWTQANHLVHSLPINNSLI